MGEMITAVSWKGNKQAEGEGQLPWKGTARAKGGRRLASEQWDEETPPEQFLWVP